MVARSSSSSRSSAPPVVAITVVYAAVSTARRTKEFRTPSVLELYPFTRDFSSTQSVAVLRMSCDVKDQYREMMGY